MPSLLSLSAAEFCARGIHVNRTDPPSALMAEQMLGVSTLGLGEDASWACMDRPGWK